MTDVGSRCYAIRRLNPFKGVIQVVEIPVGRAISTNGVVWQIQVLAERPEHTWGSLNQHSSEKQFFRFGLWSQADGLQKVSVNPILDVGAMLQAAEAMSRVLLTSLPDLPFRLEDNCELWLMDREQRPLALLASTIDAKLIPEINSDRWCATVAAKQGFVSPSLTQRGIAVSGKHNRRRHAEYLEQMVMQRADSYLHSAWYRDDQTGVKKLLRTARDGIAIEPELPSAVFPRLLLSEHWVTDEHASVVREYHDWLAPWLLTLDSLDDQTRARLESSSRQQAVAVDNMYPLYPKVIDRALIDTARVEAKLKKAAEAAAF